MKGKESSKKIVIRGVIVVVSAIILLIAIDLLNVLAFNGKPMFLISENDTKQSSILYDIYDCNGNIIATAKSVGQINRAFNATSGKRYFIKIYNICAC